jgi:hypothetical protein
MLTPKQLQQEKVEDIDHGHALIRHINWRIDYELQGMQEAADAGNNLRWKHHSDEKYELVKARRHIQNEMGKIVKAMHA